jgi:hypothetical protein
MGSGRNLADPDAPSASRKERVLSADADPRPDGTQLSSPLPPRRGAAEGVRFGALDRLPLQVEVPEGRSMRNFTINDNKPSASNA